MALQIQNLNTTKIKLRNCDTSTFENIDNSFVWFTRRLNITQFRHIRNLPINFSHPVTAIAGSNRIGKTSVLLLLACSHEDFRRLDASSSAVGMRDHAWNDVLSFTSHETVLVDYQYEMDWRQGKAHRSGIGKRLHTSRAWSGLGKKSSDAKRINAKIRGREVRLVDLERLLPARAFSDSLYRKANLAVAQPLHAHIAQAFAYVFDTPITSISEAGGHVNRRCFLIERAGNTYSTYNAASGEEAVIYLLKDLIESPKGSLILIDEIEAGIHPSVQRKLLDIVHIISWTDKKQVVFTTHSPTVLSSVEKSSRKFLEISGGLYRCLSDISVQAASSKMDSVGYPLVQLYCEDDLADFLISQQLVELTRADAYFGRLINIVPSGPIDQVKNDYERHKRNYSFLRSKLGFCAIFDGDYKDDAHYSNYYLNPAEGTSFLYPYDKPEKFLIRAYLATNQNEILEAALEHMDHHLLFDYMVQLGLAADALDARNRCYTEFKASAEYAKHSDDIQNFVKNIVEKFANEP
ncbi:AAA family ATPase [Variovorax sp. EBFNA2]|uniref:AAA family ATPase n=1 Tax=Variovorax sp. EBFNA2 TaxID=3342097 RepID=UPI0029C0278A|nr:AAA family ATPase [Variovorax boronicumulans]WPG36732.1 AAA family ATPase [Variovorax boronicumulans]